MTRQPSTTLPPVLEAGGEWMEWTAPPPRSEVIAAGELLRTTISPEEVAAAAAAFNVAHTWREAHLLPLHSMRTSLQHHARTADFSAIVAGRIKRLASIRKKLKRSRISLWDMQDIAGVRAILPSLAKVDEVADRLRSDRSAHVFKRQDDHIAAPKPSGYRSLHLMMRYRGDERFHNRSIEVQIRTLRQHAWATAIEAVGLMRGEDLKAGRGHPHWLRLFHLMAGEFASVEGACPVPGIPDSHQERRIELVELERELEAVKTLSAYSRAITKLTSYLSLPGTRFVIQFDRVKQQVHIAPVRMIDDASGGLRQDERTGVESVVVEVEGAHALAEAYPNYFVDVARFADQLQQSLKGNPHSKSVRQMLADFRLRGGRH